MDINKAFEKFVEEDEAYGGTKKWKKGQNKMKKAGITLQRKDKFSGYVEEIEKEASTYRDRSRDEKKKKKRHFAFGGKKDNVRAGGSGYGKGEEVEESRIGTGDQESRALIATKAKMLMKQALKSGKKQSQDWWNKQAKLAGLGEDIEEGLKDLPPHLQKLIKKIEKKQKDWNKQNPDAKIQTLVYNPETGKPDIIVKETMKLEDTVKQIITEKPNVEEHCGVCDEQGVKEDTDKDEPGTQGDMAVYQKKRKAVAKKFGVKSCSELEGADKKACYAALDKAHVADHEEQVELENMRKEEVSETFWKVNIPDMPPVFIEAGSSSEIKKDMRKKLKPDVFKELAVERVTKSEMIKKYREMVKGDSGEDEPKEEETTISKMYGHVKTLMKVN